MKEKEKSIWIPYKKKCFFPNRKNKGKERSESFVNVTNKYLVYIKFHFLFRVFILFYTYFLFLFTFYIIKQEEIKFLPFSFNFFFLLPDNLKNYFTFYFFFLFFCFLFTFFPKSNITFVKKKLNKTLRWVIDKMNIPPLHNTIEPLEDLHCCIMSSYPRRPPMQNIIIPYCWNCKALYW